MATEASARTSKPDPIQVPLPASVFVICFVVKCVHDTEHSIHNMAIVNRARAKSIAIRHLASMCNVFEATVSIDHDTDDRFAAHCEGGQVIIHRVGIE